MKKAAKFHRVVALILLTTTSLIGQNDPTTSSYSHYEKFLAVIEGDKGSGSGFIAIYRNHPLLFTNTHVLSGNSKISAKLVNGGVINMKGLIVAKEYDVSVLQQDTVGDGMEIIDNIEEKISIGDDVVVLGNSLGAGVITELKGKITGIGPELVEVDAKFVSGNSGSPVIHIKTGKVIGIATFATLRKMEGFGKDSKFNNVERRFAYRLDNIKGWKPLSWNEFVTEAGTVSNMKKRTDDLFTLAKDISANGKIVDWNTHLQRDNTLSSLVLEFQTKLAAPRIASQEIINAKKRFLHWILIELKKDIVDPDSLNFTDYHKRQIRSEIADREILKRFYDVLNQQLTSDPHFYTR